MPKNRKNSQGPVKLEEVARRARVSASTVSRVLNNLSVVKNSTRIRVLKAVEELGYHPDLHARSLAGGSSRTIGVIVSNLENPFFFDIYKALEAGAHASNYEVVIANTNYSSEQLVNSIRLMLGRRVSGLAIVVSEIMDPNLIESLSAGLVPIVFYDVGTATRKITNIRVDYARGVRTLVEYLYSLGHRRFGFLVHHAALNPINVRLRTVLEVTRSLSPEIQVHTVASEDDLEGGRRAVRDLLALNFDPTAIICVNDIMAVGALRELRERGYEVPEDVSVTGFDDIALAQFCYPALTTVHIPRERIGRIICECLIGPGVKSSGSGSDIVIDPQLVLRKSTGLVSSKVSPFEDRARAATTSKGRGEDDSRSLVEARAGSRAAKTSS
jgi:LacI family transcriptional regulator